MRFVFAPLFTWRRSASIMNRQHNPLFDFNILKKAGVLHLDSDAIPAILKVCAGLQSLRLGAPFHAVIMKSGFEAYTQAANSIMNFYIKCGLVSCALNVFKRLNYKDSVSWNVVIHGFLDMGAYDCGLRQFVEGRRHSFRPNLSVFVLVIQASWKLEAYCEGICIHGLAIRGGNLVELPIHNSLLCMYCRFHDVDSAELVFEEMSHRDVISWSLMISLYGRCAGPELALRVFKTILREGDLNPDGVIMVGVLRACCTLGDVKQGKTIHGQVVSRGFETDEFVGNSLIDMYSKCGVVQSALKIFTEMPERNVVSWNSIFSGLVHCGHYVEALDLFMLMRNTDTAIDEVTSVNLFQITKKIGQPIWCKSIHSVIIRRLFKSNLLVMNTMIDAYAKSGLIALSAIVFERMESRDLISWSTMITGYAHYGMPDAGISAFVKLLLANVTPNSAVILSLLEACSASAMLDRAKSAHALALRYGFADEVEVGTALLDMYAKCGHINMSCKLFFKIPNKNVISWSAMINACGMNGHAREALALLNEMKLKKLKPNKVTMLSVLTACSHGGLVEAGLSCFRSMFHDAALEPSQEHYSCVIDMLARAGDIRGAFEIINIIPKGVEAGPRGWGALLSACRGYENREIAKVAASRVVELEPLDSSGYLLALSLCDGSSGSAEKIARIRLAMKENGVTVVSGYSLVHVNQRGHRFLSHDLSNPRSREIYSMVDDLHKCMKMESDDYVYILF